MTIYEDIVEPRGGELWIGNIIESRAVVGISENLVRTAVSRLMVTGQLQSERSGRCSFYRLTPIARAEFAYAAKVLYDQESAEQWQLVYFEGTNADTNMRALKRLGHDSMRTFVSEHWDLLEYAQAYQGFLAYFEPAETLLPS